MNPVALASRRARRAAGKAAEEARLARLEKRHAAEQARLERAEKRRLAARLSDEEIEALRLKRLKHSLYMRTQRRAARVRLRREARSERVGWTGEEIRLVCGLSLTPGNSWSHMFHQWKFAPYWPRAENPDRVAANLPGPQK